MANEKVEPREVVDFRALYDSMPEETKKRLAWRGIMQLQTSLYRIIQQTSEVRGIKDSMIAQADYRREFDDFKEMLTKAKAYDSRLDSVFERALKGEQVGDLGEYRFRCNNIS